MRYIRTKDCEVERAEYGGSDKYIVICDHRVFEAPNCDWGEGDDPRFLNICYSSGDYLSVQEINHEGWRVVDRMVACPCCADVDDDSPTQEEYWEYWRNKLKELDPAEYEAIYG